MSPFKLESKEAKVILIEVGVAIAREVWEKVEKQIEVGKDLPYQQEDKIFENAGLMKFGQMAPSKEDPGAYGKGGRIIYYRMWISKEDGGRAEETFDITGF